MKKILTLFLLLVSATPVFATNWLQVGYKIWIDLDSIKSSAGITSAWFKDLNPGDWDNYNNKKIWYRLNLIDFKCSQKQISAAAYAIYDLKGNLLDSDNWNSYSWQPVIPDSVGEYKYNFVCK